MHRAEHAQAGAAVGQGGLGDDVLARLRARFIKEGTKREGARAMQLLCTGCGNHCRTPGCANRAYACPRCGHVLQHPQGEGRTARRRTSPIGVRADPRAALSGTIVMAAAALAIHAGLSGYRAAAAGSEPVASSPVVVRLTAAQARSYAFRQRQLEADLARDESDYEVLLRLGQLHLQLAECQGQGAGSHLRRARNYLLLAGLQVEFRSDAFLVHSLLEAANEPKPALVLATLPGDVGPPAHDNEEWIRWRLGALEERMRYQPGSSRLMRLLGDNYVALSLVPDSLETTLLGSPSGDHSISERQLARLRARQCYSRAIACARTHESLCRALFGQAQLFRLCNQPQRAVPCLTRILKLEPNRWLVSLEMAAVNRQLGKPAEASAFEALAAHWRTPSWL